MKKIITFAAVMGTACFQGLSAQSIGPMTNAIGESFHREFKEASSVRWVKIKSIYQARFYNHLEYCIAFFDATGQLLLSGRKIPFDKVAPMVKKEMSRIRTASEQRHDPFTIAGVYELSYSRGIRYFINLESDRLSVSILSSGNGTPEVVKKVSNRLKVAVQ